MVLNKDLREFVGLLNEKGVKYLVIGGYAVAYHGYPRYTKAAGRPQDKVDAKKLKERKSKKK